MKTNNRKRRKSAFSEAHARLEGGAETAAAAIQTIKSDRIVIQGNTFGERPVPADDPRVTTALGGIRFHSGTDRKKAIQQLQDMLHVQIKESVAAVDDEARRRRSELQMEISRLEEKLWQQMRRHTADLIELSRPQTSANECATEADRRYR